MFELMMCLSQSYGVSLDDVAFYLIYASWAMLVVLGLSAMFLGKFIGWLYVRICRGISAIRSKLCERKRGT